MGYSSTVSTWAAMLAALAAGACHGVSRQAAAIGYAFPDRPTDVVRLAEQVIDAANTPRLSIQIVRDTTHEEDAPDVEVKRAELLVAVPGVVAVVGHSSSRGSLAAAPVYNEAKIVQLTPTSTSRLLWSAGPWTFNLAPNDSVQGALIGRFVAERLGARRVTIFFVNDEYGLDLRDGVAAELQRRGVAIGDRVSMDLGSDFATLVRASLARSTPDVVVVAGRQLETGTIARLLREYGIPRAVVGGDGALSLPQLLEYAGPAADSIYAVAFWAVDDTNPRSRAFVADYRRVVGGTPQSFDAMTYDALLLLATAIRAVGPTPSAVRGYLLDLGRGRPPYPGVTGPITFAPSARPRLMMMHLRGGVLHRVQ
jgi:branched-chain amino acid transport system substrate-binding protein